MPPRVASLIFWSFIIALIVWDRVRNRDKAVSWAVWIPIIWLMIGGTRNVSEWLAGSVQQVDSPDQYLDGSPLDRLFVSGLLAAGLAVLIARGRRTADVLQQNAPLVLFFVYCLASALWSDFPFVAFKRWTKGLGNAAMILILLTELDPIEAIKRFFARVGFVLVPLSVLYVKYYPQIGRGYDRWDGRAFYNGVAPSKNLLGCILLVVGLPCVWRFMRAFWEKPKTSALLVHGTILAMILWLLKIADSATSKSCFALGCAVMAAATFGKVRRPARLHFLVLGLATCGLLGYVFRDAYEYVVQSLGRNTTLTGRTELWDDLIVMIRHPWFGTGFESFFLGDRAKDLWAKYWWHPNEAHNGFFEIFLTLGWVGLSCFFLVILSGYRNVVREYRRDPALGSLRLAFLVAAIVYNFTEAAFKVMNPVWITFMLAVMAMPDPAQEPASEVVPDSSLIGFNFKLPPPAPTMGDLAKRRPVS
jgi:exopolysaccharide production protein ExoQ